MHEPPVPSKLPSSQQGVSLQPTVTSHHSEQVKSNVPQQGASWNHEPSQPPTPGLSHSLSPAASRCTTDRQAISVQRSGIHETHQVNQEVFSILLLITSATTIIHQPGIDYDVLGWHHSFNSHRRSPSPTYLRDVCDSHASQDHHPSKKIHPDTTSPDQQSAAEEMMDVDNAGAKSVKCEHLGCSRSTVIPKPTMLVFYPPLWMKLLDKAKARIWLHVATEEPFLRLETAVDGQCSEIIIELVVKYQEDSSELEAAVKQKAAVFLEGAKLLRGECDSLGRASNFAHSALQNICLAVYYSNSVKSLRQYVEFQHFVPYKALALVTTIVSYL
ncbi:hypothetical protein PISMIDRAFT_118031, partial [Pisolithus microcarpus 441]